MKENSKMSQLFSKVRELFAEMNAVESDKGTLYFEGELGIDSEVFLRTGEDYVPAPTGKYMVSGVEYKITDGVVIEMEKTEAPVEEIPEPATANVEELGEEEEIKEDEMACGKKQNMEGEEIPVADATTVVEPVMAPEPNPDYVTRAELDALIERVNALEALAKPTGIPIDDNTRYSKVMSFVKNL